MMTMIPLLLPVFAGVRDRREGGGAKPVLLRRWPEPLCRSEREGELRRSTVARVRERENLKERERARGRTGEPEKMKMKEMKREDRVREKKKE
jgi:hypothetical protein